MLDWTASRTSSLRQCSAAFALEVLQTRVLGLPQSIEIDSRPDEKFRQGFMGALLQQRGERTNIRFPGLLARSLRQRACSFYGVRVGVRPGVGPDGWLRCFAHPLGGVACRGRAQDLAFAPGSSEMAVGFFVGFFFFGFIFVFLYLLGPEFAPTVHAHSYF